MTKLKYVGLKEEIQKAVVTGVEMFRKQLDEGIAGDKRRCPSSWYPT